MPSRDVLYIVMPAYNEADNIADAVGAWYPVVEGHDGGGASRMVVIDDGSADDTYRQLQALAADRPLMVAATKENEGHGPTVLHGYRMALDAGADFVFQTDSDGQTEPAEFEGFWELREGCDAVIGARAHREDGFARALAGRAVGAMVRAFFHVRVPDANAPFRLMSAGYLREILPFMPQDYFLPNIMLTAIGVKLGKRVEFREITFRPRQGGVNSLSLGKVVRIGLRSVGDFARISCGVARHLKARDGLAGRGEGR